jgi:PAS domain S-box-containing protein
MVSNQTISASQAIEQRYHDLFDNMPICFFVIHLTVTPAVILEVNRRGELTYGYTAAELVGKPVTLLVPEESRASIQNILQRVRRGETVTAEITNRHRDGTTFPVRIIAILDPIDTGRMLITAEDISAEKQRRTETEAIEAERLRIAHEIHDGVAQNLAGLRLKTALWSHLAESAPLEMRASLNELQAVLSKSIDDIRRAIFALRPVDLESIGFVQALTRYVTDFGDQNQVVIQLKLSGNLDSLPAVYELPLFRIIQEGLNNINHHAHASSVLVQLIVDAGGGVYLSLVDNGQGFDTNTLGTAGQSRHFGLLQMRERIQELGGTLDIHSVIGQGTELCISLPQVTKELNEPLNNRTNDVAD